MAQKKISLLKKKKKKISLSGSLKSATEEEPDLGIPERQSENRGMKKPPKT